MYVTLNQAQAKGLANFFFDIAKAIVIGGIGFSAVNPVEIKIITIGVSLVTTYICLQVALTLLQDVK